MDGDVAVAEREGGGADFQLRLPLSPSPPQAAA